MNMIVYSVYALFAFLGACVGSFLNVCIYRIPRGESIVLGASHCPKCDKKLKPLELIPILSYIFLKAKCSNCGCKISPRYPIIEALNALIWLVVLYVYDFSYSMVLGVLLASVLLVISAIDADTREIPPSCTLFILILGIAKVIILKEDIINSLVGFLIVSGVLYIIFMLSQGRAIGGGDVKLMAAAGLFLGALPTLLAFVLACIMGSVIHIVKMIFFGASRDLALGPYLAMGIYVSFLYGDTIIENYLKILGL